MITKTDHGIQLQLGHEKVQIEAWGQGIRVRAVPMGELPAENWALTEEVPQLQPPAATATAAAGASAPAVRLSVEGDRGAVECCGLRCEVTGGGHLQFLRKGDVLLEEREYPWSLRDRARVYRLRPGSDLFEAGIRFQAYEGERLYGMGQYRDARWNCKGMTLELAHRNSQISVPFLLSSRGYGFLWNNPAIGRAVFAENVTEWTAEATGCVDYWICTGDSPAEILGRFTEVTGRAAPLPENLLGLWQCKLRYRSQEELLEAAREYHRRGIPLDVIVVDFFHWVYQGDWAFDPVYWPDPLGMVEELQSMGTRLMVSVWPTVDPRSPNYRNFADNGYLIRTERGLPAVMDFHGYTGIYDATNPAARKFAYSLLRQNYRSCGINLFWLDEAEPEYSVPDFDHYRQHIGPVLATGNLYPKAHAQMVWEGLKADGVQDVLSLIRCAWVGSAKYGALVWSGDIESSFQEMKVQIRNGLNMGLAGIPWWISDTGGFYGGDVREPVFQELLVRWFQWAVYTPILRMHGDRLPSKGPLVSGTDRGGGFCPSGADNELWVYGDAVYEILLHYLEVRKALKPYLVQSAHETEKTGLPLLRAMFLEFPEDPKCWQVEDQYMFGPAYLVAPVTDCGARERQVYLPRGRWEPQDGGPVLESSGEYVTVPAPLEYMPVFKRL